MPRLAVHTIVSVLAAAIILFPAFAANATAVMNKVAETTIIVNERCDGPVIAPDLFVKDRTGNVIISQATAGTQLLIEGSVFMDCFQYPENLQTAIFEVKDKQGHTTHLAWQQTLSSEDLGGQKIITITAGVSWTPDKPGTYTVRFFPIVCMTCTPILHNVVIKEITVVV